MGMSIVILLPTEAICSQASNSLASLESLSSAMVQDTYILLPLWTGLTSFLGWLFHLSLEAEIISNASLAATFLNLADSQLSFGRSTIGFKSWVLSTFLSQK